MVTRTRLDWPIDGGEMGERIRTFDWTATPLGPIGAWPERLKAAVDNMLASGFAGFVWWGPELVQLYNDAALAIVRAKHPALLGTAAREGWAEVWPEIGPLVDRVLGSGRARVGEDLPLVPERGGERETAYFTFSYSPLRDAEGAVAGMQVAAIETTQRVLAERALRESQDRLQAATDLVGMACYTWDARTNAFHSDARLKAMCGLPPEADGGLALLLSAIHPEDRPRVEAARARCFDPDGDGIFQAEPRVIGIGDGVERWISTRGRAFFEGQRPVGLIGAALDVTDRRESGERLEVLVGELQHRTRNLLGLVRTMADKTLRSSTDLEDFRNRFDGRLDALARVQGLLSRLDEGGRVTFDELIRSEMAAMAADPGRITLEGPAGVRLRSSTVQTLALALHELATNAVKYGALGQAGAHLSVTWALQPSQGEAAPRLTIDWRERGVAAPSPTDETHGGGQGRELIERALPYQLRAKTTYRLTGDGVHCTIEAPVSATARREPCA